MEERTRYASTPTGPIAKEEWEQRRSYSGGTERRYCVAPRSVGRAHGLRSGGSGNDPRDASAIPRDPRDPGSVDCAVQPGSD